MWETRKKKEKFFQYKVISYSSINKVFVLIFTVFFFLQVLKLGLSPNASSIANIPYCAGKGYNNNKNILWLADRLVLITNIINTLELMSDILWDVVCIRHCYPMLIITTIMNSLNADYTLIIIGNKDIKVLEEI